MACCRKGFQDLNDVDEERKPWYRRKTKVALVVLTSLVFLFAIVAAIVVAVRPSKEVTKPTSDLANHVTNTAIMVHLNAFQTIAEAHLNTKGDPSRSVVNGYNASAEYVAAQLESVGYTVERDYFVVPVYEELSSPLLSLQNIDLGAIALIHGVDFHGITYGGNTNGVANIVFAEVLEPTNAGCDVTDWAADMKGKVAMFPDTTPATCANVDRALIVEGLGAVAVLVYGRQGSSALPGGRLRKVGWAQGDALLGIPGLGISYTARQLFQGATANMTVNVKTTLEITYNLYTETAGGNAAQVVGVGAHLDSVADGPGLVDNGSGSASVLELALQYAKLGITPTNKIRFMWWGAEELGLLGSYHYTSHAELDEYALYLNFDMVASPNYVRYVHDGQNSNANELTRNASTVIENMFTQSFSDVSLPVIYFPMIGGTDWLPFILAGVPANGLFTGAGLSKTMEQRTMFGGWAQAAQDPCYHRPCDNIANVNPQVLGEMALSMVTVMERVAGDSSIRGTLGTSGAARRVVDMRSIGSHELERMFDNTQQAR